MMKIFGIVLVIFVLSVDCGVINVSPEVSWDFWNEFAFDMIRKIL